MSKNMQKIFVILFGIIFIGVGVFIYYQNNRLQKVCTVESIATVVDYKEELSTDSDGFTSSMFYPIIEYSDNRNTQKVQMNTGSSHLDYNIGDKITILYNPDKTTEFIVKGEKTSSIFSIVFIVLGVLISGFGIIDIIRNK